MIHPLFRALAILLLAPAVMAAAPDEPFIQEIHEPHPLLPMKGDIREKDEEKYETRAAAVDASGVGWATARTGIYYLKPGAEQWTAAMKSRDVGPASALLADPQGGMWIGSWNGILHGEAGKKLERVKGIDKPVSALAYFQNGDLLALGPDGAWRLPRGGEARPEPLAIAGAMRDAADTPSGLWIASGLGLYRITPEGTSLLQGTDDLISADVRGLATDEQGRVWAGGYGGVAVLRDGKRESRLTAAEGLPNSEVRCVERAPDGRVWIGTAHGVARYDGQRWSLLHGHRWLLSDDVRGISFAPDGAAWIATAHGVSVVRPTKTTLAKKSAHYLEALYARHIRKPGIVEKCVLMERGDLKTFAPRDDDNDGGYTAIYMAMQSYRFAATGDPDARQRARDAFAAVKFLQDVTETPGFFARSVVPRRFGKVHDENEEIDDAEWADGRAEEPRFKKVEERWRRSADHKWRWKGDTSSDEATAHFFGYLMYFEHGADEAGKRDVAALVAKIMDGIIDGGYYLRDIDGQPTRWGVWAPERLNRDPLWTNDRGVNSVEILSYLKVAHRVTGNAKYRAEYERLARQEGYAQNTRRAKNLNPSTRTHIDDELLALSYPGLMIPDGDDDLMPLYRESLEQWHAAVAMEQSPFFNFIYASCGGKEGPMLDDSLFFLRDAPLDLIRWTMDNTKREDVRITRLPEFEHIQTDRVLPPSERGVMRWDDNPWIAVQGDHGRTESDGVYWLLPYWMGRFHGYIAPK